VDLEEDEARGRFVRSPGARLETCDERGQPHLVPVTFAVQGDIIVIAIDHKPKRSTNLKRLRDIADNPWVSAVGRPLRR